VGLFGEAGREVKEFYEQILAEGMLARWVRGISRADERDPLMRLAAPRCIATRIFGAPPPKG